MIVRSIWVLGAGALVVACSQEAEVVDDPETLDRLERCETARAEHAEYIAELEERLADLEMARQDGVTADDDEDEDESSDGGGGTSAPRGSGGAAAATTALDEELYENFVDQTQRSRQAITRCYQNTLKNDPSLQARTIRMQIEVDYDAGGAVQGASFSPQVSPEFDTCMQAVVDNWELPATTSPVTFTREVTLTPEQG